MTTRRAKKPSEPHPVLTNTENSTVGGLQVRRDGQVLKHFAPSTPYVEIHESAQEFGAGRFTVVGTHITSGNLLADRRDIHVTESDLMAVSGRRIGEAFEVFRGGRSRTTTEADELSMMRERHRMAQIEDERRVQSRREHEKQLAEERADFRLAVEKAQEENVGFLMGFMERQSEADRQAREREELRRLEWRQWQQEQEGSRRHLEESARSSSEEDRRLRLVEEREQYERLRRDRDAEAERRIREERRKAADERRLQSEAFQQQLLLHQQKMDLSVATIKAELEAKYKMQQQAPLMPTSIQNELWKRQLDEEWPKKSRLEEFAESYVEPVLELYRQVVGGRAGALPSVVTPQTFQTEPPPLAGGTPQLLPHQAFTPQPAPPEGAFDSSQAGFGEAGLGVGQGGDSIGMPTHIPGFPGSGVPAPPPTTGETLGTFGGDRDGWERTPEQDHRVPTPFDDVEFDDVDFGEEEEDGGPEFNG